MQRFDAECVKNQLLFVVVCVAAALVWPLYFINLFPLSEARDWLIWGSDNAIVQQVFENLLWRNTRFSRDFSMLAMFGIGRLCDSSVFCVNALVSVPLVLAALALFELARLLIGRASVAAFITVAWCLSLAFLSTASWQATIHDRLGVLCALSALMIAWRLRPDATLGRLVVYSSVIAALNFGALNSKEAYWFVPPVVILCHWFRQRSRSVQRSLTQETLILLPLMTYSAWHFLRYLQAGELASEWSGHVGSGALLSNASAYTRGAFGSLALFAILGVALLWGVRDWRQMARANSDKILWCSATFLLSYAPIARTRFAAEYYFLAPLALLLLLGAMILASCQASQKANWCKGVVVAVLVIGLIRSQLTDVAHFFRERTALSDGFRGALGNRIAVADEAIKKGALCIVGDPQQRQTYLFTDSQFAWNILQWDARQPLPIALKSTPLMTRIDAQCAQIMLNKTLQAVQK